jgi:hypothetical protein
MTINIDFDGTVTTHAFPKVGKSIGAQFVLKRLVANGHKLILFTMRSDKKGKMTTNDPDIVAVSGQYLTDAVNWFKENGIPLHGIQSNPDQKTWTDSPKSYAELMIDDSALGCPLKYDRSISNRPFVDWLKVEEWLESRGII